MAATGDDGLEPLAPGELAAIVTHLELTRRPPPRPLPPVPLRLTRWAEPQADHYRALFRRVGGPWLWFSRLLMDDAALLAIIRDPAVSVHAATDARGIELGLLELDFREPGETKIAYFGLVPEMAGQGHGRWLMAQAQALGWRRETARITVHTCTLDHPKALGFYRAQGFVPVRQSIERFADPRVLGVLPRDIAPQVPLIED